MQPAAEGDASADLHTVTPPAHRHHSSAAVPAPDAVVKY